MLEVKPKEVDFYESEQILCSCRSCKLRRQPDYLGQQNGLFEAFKLYNENNGSSHYYKFLPKFHPELNPIERVWLWLVPWLDRRTKAIRAIESIVLVSCSK